MATGSPEVPPAPTERSVRIYCTTLSEVDSQHGGEPVTSGKEDTTRGEAVGTEYGLDGVASNAEATQSA
jgi:hypothetical protein